MTSTVISNTSQTVALSSQVQPARCSAGMTTMLPFVRPLHYFTPGMWVRDSDCGSPSAPELNILVGVLWSHFLLLLPSIQRGLTAYVTIMIHE